MKTRVPKTETNIANVSVVNLVKYISDKRKPGFLYKMQPKFTADEKVQQLHHVKSNWQAYKN